jgi:glycine betaine catabolism B
MKANLVSRLQLTDSIASFSFRPEREFSFTAGQYISLTLTDHVEAGQPAERWFTISSSPDEEVITITTRVGNAAHTPFKRALYKLQAGAEVDISEPMGAFVLPKLHQTPLVFVAGGIGITPFNSIFNWLHHTGETRDIRMLYSVKNEDDIIMQDTFNKVGQHVTLVVSEPSAAWGGERGELTAEMIIGIEKPSHETLIFISGPEPFVQKLQADLESLGISNQQIVIDEFQGYKVI